MPLTQTLTAAAMSALLALAPQAQTIGEDKIRWETKPSTPREM